MTSTKRTRGTRYGRNRRRTTVTSQSNKNKVSIYGVNTLETSEKIFGNPSFRLNEHIKHLYSKISASDAKNLLKELKLRKEITSSFLSEHVVRQYTDFISMSRYVLEIEDKMSEMDDMLKAMSVSMKNLHSTKFELLSMIKHKEKGIIIGLSMNEEEQRDREQQEMEALESMHEQISQHIQLRQLQQATDLIVSAKKEYKNLKRSAKKRAVNFINSHISELHDLITYQLSTKAYIPEMKREKLCLLLMRLGYVDETMQLYLIYRSRNLKHMIRNISLYGDVKQYMRDLSRVFFDELIDCTSKYTNILNRMKLDEENKNRHEGSHHMSRLIVWIYSELQSYAILFEQQVFQLEQNDFRTIGECLKIVFKQSERLNISGIHISFLLSNKFQLSIEYAINRLYKQTMEKVKKCMERENWISKSKNVTNNTKNAAMFHQRRLSRRLSLKSIVANMGQTSKPKSRNSAIFSGMADMKARISQTSTVNNSRRNSLGDQDFTIVKLTKSGEYFYELIKKCIQETWRLLDNKFYTSLTKSVYKIVVKQMIFLFEEYTIAIVNEINKKAPKSMTMSDVNKYQRKIRISDSTVLDDDTKELLLDNQRISVSVSKDAEEFTEIQMLSLIANVYYITEDLLNRISFRYHRLFVREIPELAIFQKEQRKLYEAQFSQFAKRMVGKWISNILQWKDGQICNVYDCNRNVSVMTATEIAKVQISKSMLAFVSYIVELRQTMHLYLGSNCDVKLLQESINALLRELSNDEKYMRERRDQKQSLISLFGLHVLYLDFRFLMVTLHQFIVFRDSKELCNNICTQAKDYVCNRLNIDVDVDWKVMHGLATKMQYKVLNGDQLDILNKVAL